MLHQLMNPPYVFVSDFPCQFDLAFESLYCGLVGGDLRAVEQSVAGRRRHQQHHRGPGELGAGDAGRWIRGHRRDVRGRVVCLPGRRRGGSDPVVGVEVAGAHHAVGDGQDVAAFLAGDVDAIAAFFSNEYALDLAIAECPKPWLAFIDGIAMGGGLGISVTLVGMLLAASTGIVGATVVTMGLLSQVEELLASDDAKGASRDGPQVAREIAAVRRRLPALSRNGTC